MLHRHDLSDRHWAIIEFATAGASGSFYGFWRINQTVDLEKAPIIIFGSEGGYHPVAKNLDAFLQLLTFNGEPSVDWQGVFYDREAEATLNYFHQHYCLWLKDNFGLEAIDDVDFIVEEAQQEFKQSFEMWFEEVKQKI